MNKSIIPLAILVMLGVIGAAAAWDCVRLAADARHRVELADAEMKKHEQRLINLLAGATGATAEVPAAVAAYQAAEGPQKRHAAYEEIVATFRQTIEKKVDPTNPLDRKFMDDIAGAINRREIAQIDYDREQAAYQQFLDSGRGSVARLFSARARKDSMRNE